MGIGFSLIALAAAGLGIAAATGALAPDQQIQTTEATDILNDATQNINNYCSISCGDNISNTSITVTGADTRINLSQTCSAVGAECTIKNLMSNQIDNLVTNLVQDTESNEGIFSLLGPSSTESENISNAIKNSITQLVNNTCNISTENQSNNVNAVITGNNNTFNAAQTGDMDKATCAIDTIVKNVITNTANNTAINKETSCGSLKFLIIIGVIIVIIMFVPVIKNLINSRISKKAAQQSQQQVSEKSQTQTSASGSGVSFVDGWLVKTRPDGQVERIPKTEWSKYVNVSIK